MTDQSFEYEYNSLDVLVEDFLQNDYRWPHANRSAIGKTIDLNAHTLYDGYLVNTPQIDESLFYTYESRSQTDDTVGWYTLFFILDDRFIFNFPTAYASDIGKPCLFTSAVHANIMATPGFTNPQEANTIDGKIVIIDTIHQLMGLPKKMLRIWKSLSATAIERGELLLDWTFVVQ